MELLGVSFSLQIEDQCLVEFDLSAILDPFDFNGFMLCPWAMSFCQKLCTAPFAPVSCSFPERHLCLGAFTIFWRDKQKIAGPWEANTV